ncbi:MAG: hypothetical protein V1704_02805 [Candidatus Vogelbacteria bacterium]
MKKLIIDIYPPLTRSRAKVPRIWFGMWSLAGIFLMVLGVASLDAVETTVAYYFDNEASRENLFVAASLDFTVVVEKLDNRFQTFTQGGWGAVARGNNPGVYRDANFASAFPDGAVIGLSDSNFSATFTDALAVQNFLPSGATPMPFTQDHINPITTEAGVLAGQVLALTLNVGFDLFDSNFAPSADNLKDYIIHDDALSCDGMTAQEVLDEANTILGGLSSPLTPAQINECATWINEKFNGGGGDGLAPGGSITQLATISNEGSLDFQYTVGVEKTGGDDDFCQALNLEAKLEGVTNYTGKFMDFVSSLVVYSETTNDWEFIISLPSDATVTGSCRFDFVFSGWQTTLSEFGGFSDIERVDDPVHSVTVVQEVVAIFVEEEGATTTIEVIEAVTAPIVIEEATSTLPVIEEVTEEATTTPEIIEEVNPIPVIVEVIVEETPVIVEPEVPEVTVEPQPEADPPPAEEPPAPEPTI